MYNIRNHLRKQAGEPPLLKHAKVAFSAAPQLNNASEVDAFDGTSNSGKWFEFALDTSEEMVALLNQAPDQSTGWKDTVNRLPEPWWRFAHLLFHRDPRLNALSSECKGIIKRFRQHVQLMTHDPIRKNGARALALIDCKPNFAHFGGVLTCNSRCNSSAWLDSTPSWTDGMEILGTEII